MSTHDTVSLPDAAREGPKAPHPTRRGKSTGSIMRREESWQLAMVGNCADFASATSREAARDYALALLALESERRESLGDRLVDDVVAALGAEYERWVTRYSWKRHTRDSVMPLALALAQLAAHGDTAHGQEAFWYAATARLFGASDDAIRRAADGGVIASSDAALPVPGDAT